MFKMADKQQTAVEWLVEQMRLRRDEGLSLSFYDLEMFAKKAKQMEKEQIMDAWDDGQSNGATVCTQKVDNPSEQYYNETYKNTDNEKRID